MKANSKLCSSGGTKKFSAGASGGVSTVEEKANLEQAKSHTKVIVGTYMVCVLQASLPVDACLLV